MKKRLLLLLCLLTAAGSAVWADIAQGNCKRGLWVIDDSGKLTVNINGDMADYGEGKAPWYQYADQIKAIHISSGCTNIGRNGFYGLYNVESVTGGENVEACAMYSFELCGCFGNGIPSIYFPKCSYVGECAFSGCHARAISLPLVETWKVAAITGDRHTYGLSGEYNKAGGLNFCDFVDLGSKTKKLRPGSLMGPYYVFCQNPTPPEWERLYDRDDGLLALRVVGDIVAGALTWGMGTAVLELGLWMHADTSREYEYPFGDNNSVKVIVPQEYLQTYIDFYPKNHPEVSSGYMCAGYKDEDEHGKNKPTFSTGELVAGAPIYENGQLIGGWYWDGNTNSAYGSKDLHVVLSVNEMPKWTASNAPWKSLIGNARRIYIESVCEEFKVPDDCFSGGKALEKVHYVRFSGMGRLVIGDRAFKNCPDLESVENEDAHGKWLMPVTIGKEAFSGSPKFWILDQFDVTALGESAFNGCTMYSNNYGSAKFSISNIPDYAFYGCKNLDKFDFSKISTIGKQAFGGGSGLDEVNLSNCKSVGQEAFADATLGKINFGPSTFACTFGSKCFAGCTNLGNVFVSSILDCDMAYDIFDGVTLSNVTLHCKPDMYGQCYEDDDIFGKMKVDKEFAFPVEGSVVGGTAGSTWSISSAGTLRINCWSMPNYNTNREQPWYQYREYIKDIVLDNCQIIGKNAFSEMPYLRNVSIPRDCKEIRDEAFKNCPELENIYITRVETLGSYVFEGCTKLKTIELGMHLATVGDYVFKDCHSLVDIENLNKTPAATTKYSFAGIKSGAYNLKGGPRKANDEGQSTINLNIPDAYVVNYMTDPNWSQFHIAYADNRGTWMKAGKFGDGMWILYTDSTMVISADKGPANDTNPIHHGFMTSGTDHSNDAVTLTKRIEFAGNMTELDAYFSEYFVNLETVKLSPSIKKILDGALSDCPKLKNINLGNIESIGKYAFSGTAFDILDLTNVKKIDRGAFSPCPNLAAVTLGSTCEVGPAVFRGCNNLTLVDLGGANLDKAENCFGSCKGLKVVAYNGTRLTWQIFSNCTALEKVKLGGRLESIEWSAFEGCTALDTIVVDRPTPPSLPKGEKQVWLGDVDYRMEDAWAFDGLTLKDIHLVVAPDYIPAYKKANIWKDMTIEGVTEAVEPELPAGGSLYGCGKDMYGNYVEGGGGTWYLDTDGTLTIDAPGAIAAYDRNGKPWCETFNAYVGLIKSIVVKDEVTSIPDNFFGGEHFAEASAGVETITLGEGLTVVGKNSLSFSGVKTVYIYSGEPLSLGTNVFDQDAAVQNNATLHVLSDAGYNRYLSHYKSHNSTKRFPNIVADLTQSDPKVEAVTFPITELTMYVDETINLYDLMPQFTPANVKNTKLRFNNLLTSGNVYIDDDGNMRALWEGKAYIEAWSSYTADGTELQALWGPDRASTYLKVTITEKPKPEQIFFDYIEGEGTDAAWITCHVLKDENIDVDTQIRTCEVAGYFNEDDVTTQAIPEWMKGKVDIPEKPHDFEVVRIGAFAFYEREITEVTIPWTATQIGYNAFARCYMLKDVYIPQPQPMTFTDPYGDIMEESMGHNYAFDRVGEDVDGATLHVPAGCVPAWNVYPWNEWFRLITDDAPIPDGVETIDQSPLNIEHSGGWFDLSGRKLTGKPAAPGLYIRNGKKVVIK